MKNLNGHKNFNKSKNNLKCWIQIENTAQTPFFPMIN
jgi:hypothetical protein